MPRGEQFLLRANGVGAKRAAAAVDETEADAVVSVGFCGALDPSLQVGDVVVASEVVAVDRRFASTRVSTRHAKACATGPVVSIDHVAQTAAEKSRLRATGAVAVEMEAAGVAERAAARGLPFYCIKAVTDLASEDMANDFNSALRPDGHFDTMDILSGTLRRPLVRITELIRLRKRCARAALSLGEFIADCRF